MLKKEVNPKQSSLLSIIPWSIVWNAQEKSVYDIGAELNQGGYGDLLRDTRGTDLESKRFRWRKKLDNASLTSLNLSRNDQSSVKKIKMKLMKVGSVEVAPHVTGR
ncbi:hypothetical protein Trydic_g20591 [Trypoxylus dichotomus]